MRSTVAWIALVLLAGACPEPPGPCGADAPWAQLMRGDDPDVELQDGEGIVMVHGPQGGWHLEFGVRAVDPDPYVVFDVTVDAPQGRIVDNHYDLKLAAHDGCNGWRTELFGFIGIRDLQEYEGQTPPELLAGEELHMQLSMTSSLGTMSDEVWLEAVPDPRDVEE